MNTKSYDQSKWITIADFLRESGLQNAHVRMHLLKPDAEGRVRIKSIKEMIPGTSIPRVLIDRESAEAYLKSRRQTKREDGRSKYNLYATDDEMAAIRKLLEAKKIGTPVAKPVNKKVAKA